MNRIVSLLTWQEKLKLIAGVLEKADRLGSEKDDPEGTRWIQISDTAANDFVEIIRSVIAGAN